MLVSRRFSPVLAGLVTCALTLAISTSAALAAPITVNLRVEGSTSTLFEGSIATSAETIETLSSGGPHPCDFASNGPSGGLEDGGSTSGTPTTALHDAALANGLPFNAKWFGSGPSNGNPGDFFVSQVGADANGGPPTFPSWGYAVNDTTAVLGGCQIALAPGSEVLWAYNFFNLAHLLSLSGPATVSAGTPFTVHVADGRTGEPVSGAVIGVLNGGLTSGLPSNPTTDSSGNATISVTGTGTLTLKATEPNSVRSNGLAVCVHQGNDGTCGTNSTGGGSPTTSSGSTGSLSQSAPGVVAQILGLKSGRVYSRRFAPRVLRGMVRVAPGGTLRQVRIRLQRRVGRRCFNFSGSRVRFVRAGKCAPAAFFSVGGAESFSYLLPARLAAGRYAYDIEAVDSSGRVTGLVGGVSHVVFRVR
jgi:hypothetical protein